MCLQFSLEVNEQPLSPDGHTLEHGKVFNGTYPGPWIGEDDSFSYIITQTADNSNRGLLG